MSSVMVAVSIARKWRSMAPPLGEAGGDDGEDRRFDLLRGQVSATRFPCDHKAQGW
jgi:hypothetical protein